MARLQWQLWTAIVLEFAYLQRCCTGKEAHDILQFRIGASIGLNGSCAPLCNDTILGYQYFFDWLDRRPPVVVTDASGKAYQLRLQLRLISHNCTEEGRSAAMASLISGTPAEHSTGAAAEPPVHLLLGGHGDNALQDARQADAAARILLHCCTARDTVFRQGLPHVFGIFTPASLYTGTLLRTMALRGMRRVAVVYNRESPLHVQLCEGALAQLPPLGELRPGFGVVMALNYSAQEAEVPGFWKDAGSQVMTADADVLVACDGMDRSSQLVHQLWTRGHQLSALWLASSGQISDFLTYLDGRGEFALTTVQWMPNLPYADPDFGTAAQYAAAFAAATGRTPSYYSAAATASGYVLLAALRQAIEMCSLRVLNQTNLSNQSTAGADDNGDLVDAFMWHVGALTCVDSSSLQHGAGITGRSGTDILRHTLSTLNMETFFGPVGFNAYHQNIFHPVIVTQVQNGDLVTVLPLDVADRALVMPIPVEVAAAAPESKTWPVTTAGFSVIILLCCLGLVCVGLGFLVCRSRVSPQTPQTASVEIALEDIQVDMYPALAADGRFEPGEGIYRGARVKLVVASELMVAGPPAAAGRSHKALITKSGIQAKPSGNMEESSPGRISGRKTPAPPPPPPAQPAAAHEGGLPSAPRDDPQSLFHSPNQLKQRSHQLLRAPSIVADRPSPVGEPRFVGSSSSRARLAVEFETAEGPVTTAGSVAGNRAGGAGAGGPGGGGAGLFFARQQSESALHSPSSSTAGPAPQASSGGASSGLKWQLASWGGGLLGKLSRRQTLALVWRAVRLQHPRMCPLLGIVWEWPGLVGGGGRVPVLVRQWYEFGNLERLLENETVPLPLTTKAHIAQGVAEGLAFLHAQEPPILAGPLDASRVIIDKNFNPHLFLRLQNVDSEYGTVADRSPACGLSLFAPRFPSGLLPRPTDPTPRLPQQPQQSPPSPSPSCTSPSDSEAAPVGPGTQGTAAVQQSPLPPPPASLRLPSSGGGVYGGAASCDVSTQHHSGNIPSQAAAADLMQSGNLPLGAGGGDSITTAAAAATTTVSGIIAGFTASATAAAAAPHPSAPYHPSKEQDVYEFGLLMCRIFLLSSPADPGWLHFALRFSTVPGVLDSGPDTKGAAGTLSGGDGGAGSTGSTVAAALAGALPSHQLPWQPQAATMTLSSTAAAAQPSLTTIDDHCVTLALSYMRSLCSELADLAKSCLQRQLGLSFPSIVQTLEAKIIPALLAGARTDDIHVRGGGEAPTIRGRSLPLLDAAAGGGPTDPKAAGGSSPRRVGLRRSISRTRGELLKGARPPNALLTLDDLIHDFFPPMVARALQAGEVVQPERYECVSIFFSDVVGYTDLCGQLQPGEVMDLMHRLYSRFDDLVRKLRLFKVETVGDAYLAVANLRWPHPDDHAARLARFALAAVRAASSLPVHPERPELGAVHIRVGLHCGPVVGSVVGTLNRRYCLFGDAVNTAARMEHSSAADRINCSGAFAALLREQWGPLQGGPCVLSRGLLPVKGKGTMELFWLVERQSAATDPEAGGPESALLPDGRDA